MNMRYSLLGVGLLLSVFAWADVPDATVVQAVPVGLQNSEVSIPSSVDVQVLQQQVDNLNRLDLPGQIQQLQQAISDLRGIVEIQGHEIQDLKNQLNANAQNANAPSTSSTDTAASAAPDAVSSTDDDQKKLYDLAFQNIATKDYSRALEGMQAYLAKYPQGKFAANAHYWLGELYAISGDNDQAKQEFNTVISQFSTSNKVAESMLKLGLMSEDAGNTADAQQWFQQVVQKFPNSSAAQLATQHLQKAGSAS